MKKKLSPPYLQQRSSGVLLPVFSLPGGHGIGDVGDQALRFIDFLHDAGQRSWQILPMGPTEPGFADSPYMSPSAFAANPLYISLEKLIDNGLLNRGDFPPADFSEYSVDYQRAAAFKLPQLRLAWERFSANASQKALEDFARDHPWVNDYALFRALRTYYSKPWYQWPDALKKRNAQALSDARQGLASHIGYTIFEQYLFFSQWNTVRRHAEKKKVKLIGDLPIYVALDSADVWANQSLFQLDRSTALPTSVAGVPPDYFSETGQLWGNPLYRWGTTGKKNSDALLDWWETRLHHNFAMTDIVRIDHFRGFESYWSVPASEETAVNGKWNKGPGSGFFKEMENRIGRMEIIAEDLGIITPAVEKMRDELGFPGMKILLFAFDGTPNNSYLPHNHIQNCVIYTGTHDNDTAVGWYLDPEVPQQHKLQAKKYANQNDLNPGIFSNDLIHMAYASVANLVILPMQDILGFGNDCRTNTPGTVKDNWRWRCAPRFITDELARNLNEKTCFFNRFAQPDTKS